MLHGRKRDSLLDLLVTTEASLTDRLLELVHEIGGVRAVTRRAILRCRFVNVYG